MLRCFNLNMVQQFATQICTRPLLDFAAPLKAEATNTTAAARCCKATVMTRVSTYVNFVLFGAVWTGLCKVDADRCDEKWFDPTVRHPLWPVLLMERGKGKAALQRFGTRWYLDGKHSSDMLWFHIILYLDHPRDFSQIFVKNDSAIASSRRQAIL